MRIVEAATENGTKRKMGGGIARHEASFIAHRHERYSNEADCVHGGFLNALMAAFEVR